MQTLNLALATGFIVTCGDAVQAIWDARAEEKVGSTNVLLLILIIAVGAKVAYDDHVALAAGKIRPFGLLDTSFLIATYSLLISASALIVDFDVSTLLFAAYFAILWLWNGVILLILCFGKAQPATIDTYSNSSGLDRRKLWFACLHTDKGYRKDVLRWMIIDFAGAAILFFLVQGAAPRESVLVAIAIFLLFDLYTSRSFGK